MKSFCIPGFPSVMDPCGLEAVASRRFAKRKGNAFLGCFVLCLALSALGCSNSGGTSNSEGPTGKASTHSVDGALVFAENCAVCHALPILGSMLEQNRGRPPGFVYDALTEGNMRRMGAPLDEASRRAAAEFFTGVAFDSKAT